MKNQYDDLYFWWYDEGVKIFLLSWYLPSFIMGNVDEWLKMGITLNGMRPTSSDSK